MSGNTTIGISNDLKDQIDQLAAKETLKRGKKVKTAEMVEILVKMKKDEKQ